MRVLNAMRLFLAAFLAIALFASSLVAKLPLGAENTHPAPVGTPVMTAELLDLDGSAVDLRDLVMAKPTVLIFYRGGWCPYCNAHLGELATIEPELDALGFQIIAISPERPETLAKALAENPPPPSRLVLSDRNMTVSASFGLAYQMPAELEQKYRDYGIDLAPIPDNPDHHWLPVPAAFVFDRGGSVTYAFFDHDITKRVEPAELLNAAKEALK